MGQLGPGIDGAENQTGEINRNTVSVLLRNYIDYNNYSTTQQLSSDELELISFNDTIFNNTKMELNVCKDVYLQLCDVRLISISNGALCLLVGCSGGLEGAGLESMLAYKRE